MRRVRSVLFLLLSAGLATGLSWAQTNIEVVYRQGRAPGVTENTRGTLDTSAADLLQFTWEKGSWKVPFPQIRTIYVSLTRRPESGAVFGLPGVGAKRKLLLSLLFVDDRGANRNAVFFLPGAPLREFLQALENKTGRKIVYESEEARRAGGQP